MPTALANGQLAAASATILAAADDGQPRSVNIALGNTSGSSTEVVIVTVTRSGGTARRVARVSLAANETAQIVNLSLGGGDTVQAYATDATTVDYDVSAAAAPGAFAIVALDASGGIKQGTTSYSSAQTFLSDLTLTGSTGVSHEAWDASDVSILWSNAPSRIEPDYHARCHEFWDDFDRPASATASDLEAYTSTDDGATGTNAFQDAAGGVYNVVTAAADNDYHAMSTVLERFKCASGKKLWFEARFKLSEATTNESAWWFGLTDTLTTGGFQADAAGPLASYDGIMVWKDEATMTIDFETSNAGTQATTSAMATAVTNTWTRVGFYFDGTATTSVVTPYYEVTGVDGAALVAGTAQNVTLAGMDEMHLVFGVKAGPTAAAETLQVDYIRCVQLR